MEITDVRVKLINDSGDRLRAVCTVTFDDQFVVRDVKVVDGANGLFVAMPSRKLSSSCPRCRHKNHLRAKFCGECGGKLPFQQTPPTDADGRSKLHRDIAHPITAEFRAVIQEKVIEAYEAEYEAAGEPESRDQNDYEADARDDEQAESGQDEQRDEPRAERDKPEKGAERDEYSAMIADLRGRANVGGSHDRGRQRSRSEGGRGEGGTRGEGARRGGGDKPRRGRRGGGRGRSRDREDRPAREPVAEASPEEDDGTTAVAVESPEVTTPEPAPVAEASEPRRDIEPEPTPVDTVSLDEAAEVPAASDDECDDSAPFGAGL